MMPNGMSFCGLRASSAAVETESNPMYVKKMMAPPDKMPAKPDGAKGCQFAGLTSTPPTTRKVTMAPILTTTMMLLASADSLIPQTNKTVSTKTTRKAGKLKYEPVQPLSITGVDHLSGSINPKEASWAFR